MSGHQLLLAMGFMTVLASVNASTPEDWGAYAAPDSAVEKLNTGQATPADLEKLGHAHDANPKIQVKAAKAETSSRADVKKLNKIDAAKQKGKLTAAMTETSSEEIPPPPPPIDDSHIWVESRKEPQVDETATSAVALGSSGMLRRESLASQAHKKSLQVDGIGKLRPHKFTSSQETSDGEVTSDDSSSMPTAADLGEDQMHLLENVDGEEEGQFLDPRNLLATRQKLQSQRVAACKQYTSSGQQACDKSGAYCGWRTVNEHHGSQPYCADCTSLPQTDCVSAQDKGNSKCTWSKNSCSENSASSSSSLQQTRISSSRVQQKPASLAQAEYPSNMGVRSMDKPQAPLPLEALLKKLASSRQPQKDKKGKGKSVPQSMAQKFSYGRHASGNAPLWFHGGNIPKGNDLKFEYQSAIGRDGFEPDPTEPSAEYFGPFKIDYNTHTIFLNNWNLHIGTALPRYGMGNLVVGNNQTYAQSRNGVVLGESNILSGSYGLVSGVFNQAKGRGAVVDGGKQNKALADYSTVAGGLKNNVTAIFAVVQGGEGNSASAPFASVAGGHNNIADGYSSTVQAGDTNFAYANLSAITGGGENEIPGTMVSETIAGGHKGNIPTQPPAETLTIEAGEHTAKPAVSKELDFSKLGCSSASECEAEEEEEHEDEESEEGNPATRTRKVTGGNQIDEDGTIRRRRTPPEDHEHMAGISQYEHFGTLQGAPE